MPLIARRRRRFRRTLGRWLIAGGCVAALALVSGCLQPLLARQSRLSGAVAFPEESPDLAAFRAAPGLAYVEASMRFGPDLGDDVIIFVDQEYLEGTEQPRWVKGGDWMALVGVQRAGAVWVAGGGADQLRGVPSRDRNWKILDLRQRLQPDTWYRLRVVADFGARRFVSFRITGPGLDRSFDLKDVLLDYPNYMPFDRSNMIYIVGAMRGRSMMRREGTPLVYFDDVEGGVVLPDGTQRRLFAHDFEGQPTIGSQPIAVPTIKMGSYQRRHWYLERDESIFRIEPQPFAKSGRAVGVADVDLGR